jgi:acyl carrier protein
MENEIRASLRHYIVTTWLSGDERGFDDQTDLLAAGILDSFSTLSLTAFLDESFHVELEPAEVNPANLRTVGAIAALVARKLAARPATPVQPSLSE